MPRVPTAGTTTDRIQTVPLGSAAGTLNEFQAIAGLFDEVSDVFAGFEQAKNIDAISTGINDFTNQLTDLQKEADEDPNFEGSTERFEKSASSLLGSILSNSRNKIVADEIVARGNKLIASGRVSVANSERRRFVSAARVNAENSVDDAVDSFLAATNDVQRELILENLDSTTEVSSFIDAAFSDNLREKFESSVSTTLAIRTIREDPDAFIELASDPESFAGLSPENRERFLNEAFREAHRRDSQIEKDAGNEFKLNSAEFTRDIFLGDLGGRDRAELVEETLIEGANLTTPDVKSIRALLKSVGSALEDQDSPVVILPLEKDIRDGIENARANVNTAFAGLTIGLSERNRLIAIDDARNQPAQSARRDAEKAIRKGLGADAETFSTDVARTNQQRTSFGLRDLSLFLEANPNATPDEIFFKSQDVLSSFTGELDLSSVRTPFGIKVFPSDATKEQVAESDLLISIAARDGKISKREALFFTRNNERLLLNIIRNEFIESGGK